MIRTTTADSVIGVNQLSRLQQEVLSYLDRALAGASPQHREDESNAFASTESPVRMQPMVTDSYTVSAKYD